MAHDDFLQIKPPQPKQRKKPAFIPEHGVRGIAIRLPDGTCALLDFDTGNVDVWIVGELPATGKVSGCKRRGFDWARAHDSDILKNRRNTGTYGFFGHNKIGLSSR